MHPLLFAILIPTATFSWIAVLIQWRTSRKMRKALDVLERLSQWTPTGPR